MGISEGFFMSGFDWDALQMEFFPVVKQELKDM
jgi:hypothetical protein